MLVRGRPVFAEDRRVLTALADIAGTALEGRRLAAGSCSGVDMAGSAAARSEPRSTCCTSTST